MLFSVFPVITSLVISIPFLISLDPPPTGIRLVVSEHTSPAKLLMFWGPLLTIFFTFGLTTDYYRMSRTSLIILTSSISTPHSLINISKVLSVTLKLRFPTNNFDMDRHSSFRPRNAATISY